MGPGEQLPATAERGGAGRAGDADPANARALQREPHQEHAAARAEPDPPHEPASARLRELRERMRALHAQIGWLPSWITAQCESQVSRNGRLHV